MKECPLCHTKYRDDDFYCKRDNRRLITIENSEKVYFDSFEKMAKEHQNEFNKQVRPFVECPYCHSTNTEKITNTTKVVNTAVWGIFGTKRHKNYHCNQCKSNF